MIRAPQNHQTEAEMEARRTVVRVLLRFVIPAFLVLGVGVSVALYQGWRENENDKHDLCVRRVESRDDQRRAFNAVFDVFPQDIEEVVEARRAIDRIIPPYDIGDC